LKFNRPKEESLSVLPRAAEQIIGREGETATFLSTGLFNSELREFGFAPRQFNRSAAANERTGRPKKQNSDWVAGHRSD